MNTIKISTPWWYKQGTEEYLDQLINLIFKNPDQLREAVRKNIQDCIDLKEDSFFYPTEEESELINPLLLEEWRDYILLIYSRMIHQQMTMMELVIQEGAYADSVLDHLQELLIDPDFDVALGHILNP